jgi:glycosyltransferase involved in cell wall biosynthesis
MDKALKIGVVLPTTKLFGGVRRFFELGKLWKVHATELIIFTPDGLPAPWFNGRITVEKLNTILNYTLDAIFFTETTFLEDILRSNAKIKIFYHVGPRVKLGPVLKHENIRIWANSAGMAKHDKDKYGIEPESAIGGVHLADPVKYSNEKFTERNPFVVMAFGRLSRKGKGTMLVVRACEKLFKNGVPVKLLLYDTPIDAKSEKLIRDFKTKVPFEFVLNHPVDDNPSLFKRAHVFVSAEGKGGWSNSSAEAMAAGVPVIGTKIGTTDFLKDGVTGLVVWRFSYFIRKAILRLYLDNGLRIQLAENGRKEIEKFSWKKLAEIILVKLNAILSKSAS